MKIVPFVLATAVMAIIGSSPLQAQSTEAPSGGSPSSGSQMNAPTHPGQNQWARDREWNGPPGWRGGVPVYGWMGPWMMVPHHGWMPGGGAGSTMGHHRPGQMGHHANWRRWHRQPRGARFTFTRGDARVDIRCPADQSLKECVDAASTLIDKVRSMDPPDQSKMPASSPP